MRGGCVVNQSNHSCYQCTNRYLLPARIQAYPQASKCPSTHYAEFERGISRWEAVLIAAVRRVGDAPRPSTTTSRKRNQLHARRYTPDSWAHLQEHAWSGGRTAIVTLARPVLARAMTRSVQGGVFRAAHIGDGSPPTPSSAHEPIAARGSCTAHRAAAAPTCKCVNT